ncbi:hypothetical protein [Leekyejoonella antrihumi]|uniref:hypothetical protein n=1 Tax=Leekyejoonella antrihumi TaxID=1660198 RepID=UPI00164931A5|nr:hypothetical protein [Leekyejoonella antrihumi]
MFVCQDESDVDFFARMNNTGGPIDVWEITGIEESQLLTSGSGFCYLPDTIGPERITLVETRAQPVDADDGHDYPLDQANSAYRSGVTVTLSDGQVLPAAAIHGFFQSQGGRGGQDR